MDSLRSDSTVTSKQDNNRVDVLSLCARIAKGGCCSMPQGCCWHWQALYSMVTPIACDSISPQGCKSSTCAPWLQLESIEHNILILHESLVQTCPSRCFTSDENTQTVCCQAAKPAKKLCVCDKSVPQSQSSHSHTTFTNVDLRAQTRKTAQSKNALVRRHAVLVLISCKMSLWGSLKQNVPPQIGCFFRHALL